MGSNEQAVAVYNEQHPAPLWAPDDVQLIKDTVAKGTSDSEFKLFLYTAKRYALDPLVKQIWCVKYGNNPANIFTGRDGFLSIAHRSGQFDGMESGARVEGDEIIGWCKVYRKDMERPFTVEVALSEYSTGQNLWKTKPRTMIQKVAESQCLRRAFDISGLYSPEEFDQSTAPAASKITKSQASELFRLAKGNKDLVKEVIGDYGYSRTTDIGTAQYEAICDEIRAAVELAEDEEAIDLEAEPQADMFSGTEDKPA